MIKSKNFKEVKKNHGFSLKYTSFFVPNSLEIETVFRNAGLSVTKKPEYFASLFKFAFFCLYYLGLNPDEIFLVKKSDLEMMLNNNQIRLNLGENKTITRIVLNDTRERFILLEKDLSIIFEDSDQIVHTNSDKHFSGKTFICKINSVLAKKF